MNISVRDRVRVVSVDRSKKNLEAFARKYNIKNINEVLNYDETLGCEGVVTFFSSSIDSCSVDSEKNYSIVGVKLDNWEGEVAFYKSELKMI